jgi:hypothetical protein
MSSSGQDISRVLSGSLLLWLLPRSDALIALHPQEGLLNIVYTFTDMLQRMILTFTSAPTLPTFG